MLTQATLDSVSLLKCLGRVTRWRTVALLFYIVKLNLLLQWQVQTEDGIPVLVVLKVQCVFWLVSFTSERLRELVGKLIPARTVQFSLVIIRPPTPNAYRSPFISHKSIKQLVALSVA